MLLFLFNVSSAFATAHGLIAVYICSIISNAIIKGVTNAWALPDLSIAGVIGEYLVV